MSTRPIVEAAIAAIEDNGNNTAVEVRDVLTKMLDYTENEDITIPSPTVDFFHFFNNGNFSEDRRGARLWYSCKGIRSGARRGEMANLTLRLRILESNVNDPSFAIEPELYDLLRQIVQTGRELTFAVSMRHPQFDFPMIVTLRLDLSRQNILGTIIESPEGVVVDHEVFTSIQFHAPEFF
ncbi:MAG: hypothetical protein Aureis2KO_31850 [Aureisphaera sp.]